MGLMLILGELNMSKRRSLFIILILIMVVFMVGCGSNNGNKKSDSRKEEKPTIKMKDKEDEDEDEYKESAKKEFCNNRKHKWHSILNLCVDCGFHSSDYMEIYSIESAFCNAICDEKIYEVIVNNLEKENEVSILFKNESVIIDLKNENKMLCEELEKYFSDISVPETKGVVGYNFIFEVTDYGGISSLDEEKIHYILEDGTLY